MYGWMANDGHVGLLVAGIRTLELILICYIVVYLASIRMY